MRVTSMGGGVALPNVSLCEQENEVHYNPLVPPQHNNIITYEAPAKLAETTSDKNAGLHTNAFNTTIKSHTFENGVGTIEFAEDVTTINAYAFYSSSTMTSITLPNTITVISYNGGRMMGAFYGCSGLTSITIPSSVTTIGPGAFEGCTSLTSVTIPNSVTSIGNFAFNGCSGLTSVDIPDSVTSIGYQVFQICTSLTSVTIGNGVTSIGDRAFDSCTSLTSVTIPDSVTSISEGVFFQCSGLTSVTIPDSVTNIGGSAFGYCSGLTSVTIGNGVTSIGNYAFQYCSSLTSITSLATTAPTIYSSTFQGVKTNGTLYVPQGSTGYDTWMRTGDSYLGEYNWTKVEQ